jgi:hypothetical protein
LFGFVSKDYAAPAEEEMDDAAKKKAAKDKKKQDRLEKSGGVRYGK